MPSAAGFLRMSVKSALRTADVMSKVKVEVRKGLRDAGAYVRGIAKRSIGDAKWDEARKRWIPADPGKPPRTHTGALRKSILYAVDPVVGEVLIGPTSAVLGRIGGTHEHGGTEPAKPPKKIRFGNWRLEIGGHGPIRFDGARSLAFARIRTSPQLLRVLRIAEDYGSQILAVEQNDNAVRAASMGPRNYPARPFMGPALSRALPKLPEILARQSAVSA